VARRHKSTTHDKLTSNPNEPPIKAPATQKTSTAGNGNGNGNGKAKVRSLKDLAAKYDLVDPPDESVGPESGLSFLDYGEPIVLADSSWEHPRSPSRSPLTSTPEHP
jgi:hypothetical protein